MIIACDVDNPLLGPNGATAIYGPQKGAAPPMLASLEAGMAHYHQKLAEAFKPVADIPGAGAAGGAAAGLLAVSDGQMRPGFDVLAEHIQLETLLRDGGIDCVITGEGQLNRQTLQGKLPMRLAELAHSFDIPTVVFTGHYPEALDELAALGIEAVMTLPTSPMALTDAMAQSETLLQIQLQQLIRLLQLGARL